MVKSRISTWMVVSCLVLVHYQTQLLAQTAQILPPAGQDVSRPATGPESENQRQLDQAIGTPITYINSELEFSFKYSSELQTESQESLAAKWKRSTDKSDPEYKVTDACTHILLHAFRKSDINDHPPTITIYGEGHSPKVEVKFPVVGSVTVSEISRQCLPAGFKGREDELLSAFASSVGEEPGMKLIGQPAWYEIEGHKLHAGIAASDSKPDATAKSVATSRGFFVNVAVNINKHIVLWMFEARDVYSINELVHGLVQFGVGKPQQLLPLTITDQLE